MLPGPSSGGEKFHVGSSYTPHFDIPVISASLTRQSPAEIALELDFVVDDRRFNARGTVMKFALP